MNLPSISSATAAHPNVDAAGAAAPTPEQKKAARDFEAIFLRQLLSSLEKGGGLSGGSSSGGQVFRSMMVSALADTASEGGGIGLSELILQAMLPPAPQPKLELPAPPESPPGGGGAASSAGDARAIAGFDGGSSGTVGAPQGASSWGAPGRVLTEARRAPMLEKATGLAAPALGGRTPEEGSGR